VCIDCETDKVVKSLRWDEEDGASGVNVAIYSMDASVKLVVNTDLRLTVHQLTAAVADRTRVGSHGQWFDSFTTGLEERQSDATVGSLAGDAPGGSLALFLLPRSSPPPVSLTEQRNALLAIFRASARRWATLLPGVTGWDTEAPLGQWGGLTVDDSGRVVKLCVAPCAWPTSGSVPAELAQLVTLQHIDLSRNRIKGAIPEVAQLVCLKHLDLSHNRLTGAIPADIHNLQGLLHLDVSHNLLTGPIPISIGQVVALESLNLNCNKLTGPIPAQIGQLLALERLDLSQNWLSGAIPVAEIEQLAALQHLDLPSHQLLALTAPTGVIPPETGPLLAAAAAAVQQQGADAGAVTPYELYLR
jgi:hypothetical protein